jgi:hypothetical protein
LQAGFEQFANRGVTAQAPVLIALGNGFVGRGALAPGFDDPRVALAPPPAAPLRHAGCEALLAR